MSFELENPEIAGIIAFYKASQIGYLEAKDKIVRLLSEDNFPAHKCDEARLKQQAKELLLGKESLSVKSNS